jgi:aldehyde dehydrogenase (NAD+)
MIAETALPTSPIDLHAIFDEQRRRYLAAPTMPLAERKAKLDALEKSIRKHRAAVAEAIYADFRKAKDEVEATETVLTIKELQFARAHLARWMRPRKVATPLALYGARSEVRYEPKGVVLIMSPWNYPFFLTITPLIAALAAGNRAIVRPSEKAPATSAVIGRIIRDAFSPGDVAYVGGGVETAQELLKLPFDHFFYTGSTRVGKIVMHAAAEFLAGVTLELGGKSPTFVDKSANVAKAAERIAWGKFVNAGQTCVAPDYVFVHDSVAAEFDAKMKGAVEKLYGPQDKWQSNSDYCRIVDDGAFARLDGALQATIQSGARVAFGGTTDRGQRYIAPTMLTEVKPDAAIMHEEIFGPILPVMTYSDLDQAIAFVNSRPKPLALYAFANDAARAEKIVNSTSAGGTAINETLLHLANPYLPFGGVSESGIGNYHGEFGFKAFSHERAVLIRGPINAAFLLSPPYNKVTGMVLNAMEKFM